MDRPEKWTRLRIRLVGIGFVVAFILIGVRAFHLQVLNQEEWRKRAERQHQKVIPLAPQRGTIYDHNGEELAVSVEVDSIYIEPTKVTEPARAASALASTLSLQPAAVRAKLESKRGFLWLKRQVTPRESEQVRALGFDGVNFIREHRRFYPNSEIGAQVIGFTGLDPEGLEGIELKYDSVILGQGGYLVTERDALGRGIGSSGPVIKGEARGSDVYLTIDKNLQYIAEKELAAGVRKARAKAGTVVVLDPGTGKVLAMASQPDYNPNAFNRYRPSQWRNRSLCDTFEPGSTFKLFLLAAALNEGVVRLNQTIDCEQGSFKVGGKVIRDHHPHGRLTVAEILKVSSNIGFAKIGKTLERERFHRYITDFGFGARTGIDLPGEVTGLVRKPSQWFEIDLAAISFGQGVTVTPLQLAAATAAIANGGNLMAPYVVERVVNSYGETQEQNEPRVVRRVVSADVARQVRELMSMTTEEGGTGTLATVPGFRVAGKTGTAQKADPVTGGYSVDKRVSSFVGFVPAEAPRLVILVVMDEPDGEVYGGLVAAPVFSRLASQALQYLKVKPTLPVEETPLPTIEQVKAMLEADAEASAAVAKAETESENEAGRDGEAGVESVTGDEGLPAEVTTAPLMPNCIGMSYRQVVQEMVRTGINIKLGGTGRVVDQSPAAGQPISYGNEVWVRLEPPS
ncbi:MAG TPA: penicillin-binding transpeptidase domain-containing protein [Desulfuromonadales bacterium]|nr:penicillin-binding transpeptidase domain-containing protein [Desulfuromonadales bacterium]